MNEPDEIKILVCNLDKTNLVRLENLLRENHIKNSLIQTNDRNLKYSVAAKKPDLIITDHLLWNENDPLSIVKEFREANNTPLIIWTNEASDKIVAAVFNLHHIFYIRRSENELPLIDTISKMLNPIL